MTGRIVGSLIVMCGIVAGIAMYWFQVYAFYDEVAPGDVALMVTDDGQAMPFDAGNIAAIDSNSSPIRFRACFDLLDPIEGDPYAEAVPLVAPGWFDCFDAAEIGADLEAGSAIAVLGQENVKYGIDRVLAIYPDGRGFAWHQINHCGEAVFDGKAPPDGCPPVPEGGS